MPLLRKYLNKLKKQNHFILLVILALINSIILGKITHHEFINLESFLLYTSYYKPADEMKYIIEMIMQVFCTYLLLLLIVNYISNGVNVLEYIILKKKLGKFVAYFSIKIYTLIVVYIVSFLLFSSLIHGLSINQVHILSILVVFNSLVYFFMVMLVLLISLFTRIHVALVIVLSGYIFLLFSNNKYMVYIFTFNDNFENVFDIGQSLIHINKNVTIGNPISLFIFTIAIILILISIVRTLKYRDYLD